MVMKIDIHKAHDTKIRDKYQNHENLSKLLIITQEQDGVPVSPGNPAVEPSFGCATYILGPPKIQTLSPPSIFPIIV